MKVKFNIDENLPEEKAEFWLHKMTDKISQIANELTNKKEFIWCFHRGDAYPVKFSEIYLVQVENEKTYVYTEQDTYLYKGFAIRFRDSIEKCTAQLSSIRSSANSE